MWGFWGKKESEEPQPKVCKECKCLFAYDKDDHYTEYCSLEACHKQRVERKELERREQEVVGYVKAHWRDFEKQVKRKKEAQRKADKKMRNEYTYSSIAHVSSQCYVNQQGQSHSQLRNQGLGSFGNTMF